MSPTCPGWPREWYRWTWPHRLIHVDPANGLRWVVCGEDRVREIVLQPLPPLPPR